MKKIGLLLLLCTIFLSTFAQSKVYNARVLDGITYGPIIGASIYNMNTKKFAFTDSKGNFSMNVSLDDTLLISKSIYRQLVIIVDKKIYYNPVEDFFLYYKATMLKEVRIYNLNPSYEGFKQDIVTMKLPEYYKRAEDVKLNDMEKANAVYKSGGNLLSLGGSVTMSPITYFYDKYSHKAQMQQLYNEMVSYQDEVERVQEKYNQNIVHDITGLSGNELLNFIMYCGFSYYDLVRWSDNQIRVLIKSKYIDYQYETMKNEKH